MATTIVSVSVASNGHAPSEGYLKKKKSLTGCGSSRHGLSSVRGSEQRSGRWNTGVPPEKGVMSRFISEVAV
jgi:hypothetical protein